MQRGLRRGPRPFFVSGLLVVAFSSAYGQDPVRPWLDWRTLTTPNFRFHFPSELEPWTRLVAQRVESIDSAITEIVGYSVPRPVHVVVDDPFRISNGYVLPFIDRPVTVWWATPADPRSVIGNYHTWGEMLAVHELAHIAHMTRPSRNPLQRRLWESLSANLGPIARKAPRWVYEGYATLVEGRITGTGRPHNVWRPALLRQWAIEGRLPTYGQLASWDDFWGGEFAYLSGSAFLEWLTLRDGGGGGDSSLVHVWRRLTARRVRSFDGAFAGVYGDGPARLYGLHFAELMRDAMAAKAALERAPGGIVDGELVQRLEWGTGDPAVSPDGKRVAVTLREHERPARVVIWKTAPEPEDTAAVRKRLEELKKDPLDVPDRSFYPRRKEAEKTLPASNGLSYQQPRWFADNRRVLVTRWAPRPDGTLTPDLYVWDVERDDVRRVTHGAGLLHGDPHPSRNEAVAMHCHSGQCDIARVDLARGTILTLLQGSPVRSYYRPRYSPDGSRFVASVSDSAKGWRIVIADMDGRIVRLLDPEDGANRYDGEWVGTSGDTLVVVSERGGVPNLELLSVATEEPRTLTRVTGAALAPDVNPEDGSFWFLALHSRGLDVRRLNRAAASDDSVVAITADRFGFAGLNAAAGVPLAAQTVGPSRAYGSGPRHERWFPGAYASADGRGGAITVFSGDIVGRFNATVTGAYGEPGTWKGGSLRAVWRFSRPAIELGVHGVLHEPSFGRSPRPLAAGLDASLAEGLLAASGERRGDGWRLGVRVGGSAGELHPRLDAESFTRALAFGDLELQLQQSSGSKGLVERLRLHATQGETGASYQRSLGTFEMRTIGRDLFPMEVGLTVGRVTGTPHHFEMFSVGGISPPIGDRSLLSQRHFMPMFPTGIAGGPALLAWRAALPSSWTLFYEGASTAATLDDIGDWHRAVGLETRFSVPPIPAAFVPGGHFRGGIAYTLDDPFRNRVRVYLETRLEP